MINRCRDAAPPESPKRANRYSAAEEDGAERRHQGAENSPLKNSAPRSFTAPRISDSTSMRSASLLTNSRTTDSRDAAKSAELDSRCEPRPAACALSRKSRTTDAQRGHVHRISILLGAAPRGLCAETGR